MWDAEIAERVRERKTAELARCAALPGAGASGTDRRLRMVEVLAGHIRACTALISSDGAVRPRVPSLECGEYRSALSPSEEADEEAFCSWVDAPPSRDEEILGYIRELIDRSRRSDEGISALKEELRMCRQRIDGITRDLESAREEVSALTDENGRLKEQLLREDGSPAGPAAETAQEEGAPSGAGTEDAAGSRFLTPEDMDLLERVGRLKDGMIDSFIDISLSGRKQQACEEVIECLKSDIAVINVLKSLNNPGADTREVLRELVRTLDAAPEFKRRAMYQNHLDRDQRILESDYLSLLDYLLDHIGRNHPDLLEPHDG